MATNILGIDKWLDDCLEQSSRAEVVKTYGKLTKVSGLVVQAKGLKSGIGTICRIHNDEGSEVEAEIVGFGDGTTYLMPFGEISGLRPGMLVSPLDSEWLVPEIGRKTPDFNPEELHTKHLPVGDQLLGRVVDSNARPLDSLGPLTFESKRTLTGEKVNPIERVPVREPINVGVKAINTMLTVGKGQRIGLFAGSGVGKSVLLGMMAKYTSATRIVVGLIGERGREVKEFIEDILGEEGLARSVVVAAPADCSPLLRMQGAAYASSLAEHFRSEGHDVLLLMDSLTRYAMAQREIALAIGEPPATKGYPPSVFAKLPALVERAGNGGKNGGSITAFYTVLSEGDDQQDPIADAARAILDGHIVLSRHLAEQGHYPAIDIEQSISRVMVNVTDSKHFKKAQLVKMLIAKYRKAEDLVQIGAYQEGSDPDTDLAITMMPKINGLLKQNIDESFDFAQSMMVLDSMFGQPQAQVPAAVSSSEMVASNQVSDSV